MAVNLRKKYYGKKEVSKKNRTYRYQLDFYHNGKRIRETIKEVEFLPTDTQKQRVQKQYSQKSNELYASWDKLQKKQDENYQLMSQIEECRVKTAQLSVLASISL